MSGSIWKFPILVGAILVSRGGAYGQEIHLKSRTVDTGSGSAARPELRFALSQNGPVHQIVQFDHQPGVEDLDALLAAGFKIVGAMPDNGLVVSSPKFITVHAVGVQWSGELEAADKLSRELTLPEKRRSEGGGNENVTPVVVEFHPDVTRETQQAVAGAEGLTLVRPAVLLSNHAIVTASMRKLRALALHDEVAYIFPADPALLTGGVDAGGPAGNSIMPCAGMLTLSGPIGQYANIVHGWDLDSGNTAHLGYWFGPMTAKVPAATVESEILRAMSAWSAVTNVVFEPATSATAARTIYIKFASGAHGDAYPFDSAGAILAHTFYPVPLNGESIAGDIHLNTDENWHAGGDIDIYSVALHEIGHALGLAHSDKPGDVMYPYYQRGMQLSANDIGAIQALYGVPAASAPDTLAPSPSGAVLTLTMNSIPTPGTAAQTSIAGAVSGGVPPLSLQYQTNNGYSGKIAQVNDGTWSASGVALVTGANTITVTAFDAASHTASQSESVTRAAATPASGTVPLSIVITSPSAAVSSVSADEICLAGKSSGGTGITEVTWQTSTGVSGTATGTGQWLASNVPLLVGTNTIVVRAFDATGASAWSAAVVVHQ